jgi:hypothetical protein
VRSTISLYRHENARLRITVYISVTWLITIKFTMGVRNFKLRKSQFRKKEEILEGHLTPLYPPSYAYDLYILYYVKA